MPIELNTRSNDGGRFLEVIATGKLRVADYDRFVPAVRSCIDRDGKIAVLLVLRDFEGWTAGALWEDIKFDAKHFNDLQRLAIVGESRWQRGMAVFCKPFTTAAVRFFESEERALAEKWVVGRA
jgi:hypothetical protein